MEKIAIIKDMEDGFYVRLFRGRMIQFKLFNLDPKDIFKADIAETQEYLAEVLDDILTLHLSIFKRGLEKQGILNYKITGLPSEEKD